MGKHKATKQTNKHTSNTTYGGAILLVSHQISEMWEMSKSWAQSSSLVPEKNRKSWEPKSILAKANWYRTQDNSNSPTLSDFNLNVTTFRFQQTKPPAPPTISTLSMSLAVSLASCRRLVRSARTLSKSGAASSSNSLLKWRRKCKFQFKIRTNNKTLALSNFQFTVRPIIKGTPTCLPLLSYSSIQSTSC